jgi:hypothetical protein
MFGEVRYGQNPGGAQLFRVNFAKHLRALDAIDAAVPVHELSRSKTEAGRPPLGGPPLLLSTPNLRLRGGKSSLEVAPSMPLGAL